MHEERGGRLNPNACGVAVEEYEDFDEYEHEDDEEEGDDRLETQQENTWQYSRCHNALAATMDSRQEEEERLLETQQLDRLETQPPMDVPTRPSLSVAIATAAQLEMETQPQNPMPNHWRFLLGCIAHQRNHPVILHCLLQNDHVRVTRTIRLTLNKLESLETQSRVLATQENHFEC